MPDYTLELPALPVSVTIARLLTRGLLEQYGQPSADAELAVSEAANNALGRVPAGVGPGRLLVLVSVESGLMQVEIGERGGRVSDERDAEQAGHGMTLIGATRIAIDDELDEHGAHRSVVEIPLPRT